jgi:hypothetical protein
MTAKQALIDLVIKLPEERAAELLDLAREVLDRKEQDDWREMGLRQLSRAYGDDEPDYSEADIGGEVH